jgi:hypothetical protein
MLTSVALYDIKLQMSSNKEKIVRLYVGELPLIKNVIERLGLNFGLRLKKITFFS